MTVICGGGTSSAQAGFGRAIYMAPAAVGALLNNVPTLWAVPLAAAIGSVEYDLSTFCTTDPPAVPTITADDVIALLSPTDIVAKLNAAAKFRDLVGAYSWHSFCQCDSVPTPAPPTPPAAPVGMPTINFGPGVITPCQTSGPVPLDVGAGQSFSFRASVFWGFQNATLAHFDFSQTIFSGAGCSIDYTIQWSDSVGGIISSETVTVAAGVSNYTTDRKPVANAQGVHVNVHGNTGTGRENTGPRIDIYCNGSVPGTPTNFGDCCSDPALLDAVQKTLAMVTLLQRQIAPFAFVDGPSHAGLTGAGTLAIADTVVGIKVNITTLPGRVGVNAGSPDLIYDTGNVSLGDADGWFGTRLLKTQELVWQPRWAGAVTRVGYDLLPGIVATITELLREP